MVRHQAIGMEVEGAVAGTLEQQLQNELGIFVVCKMRFAMIATDGYEINFAAEIFLRRKPRNPALMSHKEKERV